MVLDALGKVDVAGELLAMDGLKVGAEDGDLAATLDGEGDVLSRVREVCGVLECVHDAFGHGSRVRTAAVPVDLA